MASLVGFVSTFKKNFSVYNCLTQHKQFLASALKNMSTYVFISDKKLFELTKINRIEKKPRIKCDK